MRIARAKTRHTAPKRTSSAKPAGASQISLQAATQGRHSSPPLPFPPLSLSSSVPRLPRVAPLSLSSLIFYFSSPSGPVPWGEKDRPKEFRRSFNRSGAATRSPTARSSSIFFIIILVILARQTREKRYPCVLGGFISSFHLSEELRFAESDTGAVREKVREFVIFPRAGKKKTRSQRGDVFSKTFWIRFRRQLAAFSKWDAGFRASCT